MNTIVQVPGEPNPGLPGKMAFNTEYVCINTQERFELILIKVSR